MVQSWDLASATGDANDWSVCSTWLSKGKDYYLLDVWRGRLAFPSLKAKVASLAEKYRPRSILIEKARPGLHLLQEFRVNPLPAIPLPIGIHPEGDKLTRMAAQSARFEAGQVYLPREASWLAELLHEILGFLNGRFDDQVDSVSQFLNWAESRKIFSAPHTFYGPKIFVDERWISQADSGFRFNADTDPVISDGR